MAFYTGGIANRGSENSDFQFKTFWELKLTVYFIVFGVSLVGNTLVITVHATFESNNSVNNRMKAASNYFLVNMTVADLLVTVFNIPVELKAVFVGPTWLVSGSPGLALCKCYIFCWFQAVNVSTGNLSAIAIDRFLLVFYSYKKKSHQRDVKMNKKVTVMLIMIVLAFALCWLPYWICTTYCYTTKSTPVCHGYQLNFIAKFLGFSNSAFNPCIYFFFSESFRQGAKELWKRFHCSVPCKGVIVSPANAESLEVMWTATTPN